MDGPPIAKRRRIVTTCSECHRRKQKCDRRKPCNICLARNLPDRCSYSDPTVGPRLNKSSNASLDENFSALTHVEDQENVSPPASRGFNIAEQIGYSPMKGSNVFMDLQHQLLKDDTTGNLSLPNVAQERVEPEQWEDQFWTLVAKLPSKSVSEDLIGIFMSEMNWHTGFFERYYIQQLYKTWQEIQTRTDAPKQPSLKDVSRDVLYFPALLFQICAVALHFMPPDSAMIKVLNVEEMIHRNRLSERYSDHGMKIMDILDRHRPTITSVQHDLMRALWLKDCGRGTESWHALSTSTRQAQELNMHRQARVDQSGTVAETLTRLWKDEYRRRLWVILFIWDSHMSMMLGRPRLINLDDCDIQVPIDCKFPDEPSTVVPTAIRNARDNEMPVPISGHLFRYSIAQLVHEMKTNGANRRHPKDYTSIQALHEKAVALMDGLPAYLRTQNPDKSWDLRLPWIPRQREQILDNATSFLLALHRPHIHSSPKSRKAAIQAAIVILESQERVFEITRQYQYRLFGLAFFTIDAGFFLCSTTIMYPSTDRDSSRRIDVCLQEGIKRLEILEHNNAIAGSGLRLLRHCYQLLQNASTTRDTYTEPASHVPETVQQPEGNDQGNEIPNAFDTFHSDGLHTYDVPDQIHFPSTSDLTGFANINEFDSSYWIEQMNQIPFVSMDDATVANPWDFPFI
ncbi:uncharacterized protein LY89DRAFT_689606 [Mollisia scopiformis]|uniref:Zn(2)-C6 fungal-type domain-containing protein n=1 Tax=Mollisia scopiformis TaxID=149040 RepID=A0A132BD21_MOLSC|nr:uncharacterized protein LY89DRAFT_689606 [Mollisia scopiformis]KUJ10325.1 hypothetical protein LY89DRAFT_689606 [Mollisia scopiformis]